MRYRTVDDLDVKDIRIFSEDTVRVVKSGLWIPPNFPITYFAGTSFSESNSLVAYFSKSDALPVIISPDAHLGRQKPRPAEAPKDHGDKDIATFGDVSWEGRRSRAGSLTEFIPIAQREDNPKYWEVGTRPLALEGTDGSRTGLNR
jgi:hypothetical protein